LEVLEETDKGGFEEIESAEGGLDSSSGTHGAAAIGSLSPLHTFIYYVFYSSVPVSNSDYAEWLANHTVLMNSLCNKRAYGGRAFAFDQLALVQYEARSGTRLDASGVDVGAFLQDDVDPESKEGDLSLLDGAAAPVPNPK